VLPDEARAEMAVQQARKVYPPGRPCHLTRSTALMLFIQIREPSEKAAARLGLSEGAVKVAIHRLRKRFRDLVKAEIAQTVSTEQEARGELRYLIEVVS
jgi:hypothetical protein